MTAGGGVVGRKEDQDAIRDSEILLLGGKKK